MTPKIKPPAALVFTLTLTPEDIDRLTRFAEAAIACDYDGAADACDEFTNESGEVDPVAFLDWTHRSTHHAVSRPGALIRAAAQAAAAKGAIPAADFARLFPEETTRDGGKGKRTSEAAARRAAIPAEVKPETPSAAPATPARRARAAPVKVPASDIIPAAGLPPPPAPSAASDGPIPSKRAPKSGRKSAPVKSPPASTVSAPAAIAADPLAALTPAQRAGLLAMLSKT